MTLYQQIEQLFTFRLSSVEAIGPYLRKMDRISRFDDKKKIDLLTILSQVVGNMEEENSLLRKRVDILESMLEGDPRKPISGKELRDTMGNNLEVLKEKSAIVQEKLNEPDQVSKEEVPDQKDDAPKEPQTVDDGKAQGEVERATISLEEMSWPDLMALGRKKDIFKAGMTKAELLTLLQK